MKLSIAFLMLLAGCQHIRLSTEHSFMGPDVYVATDGKTEVRYYNGKCCCNAKEVLAAVVKDANEGIFDWSLMRNEEYKDKRLHNMCTKIREKR